MTNSGRSSRELTGNRRTRLYQQHKISNTSLTLEFSLVGYYLLLPMEKISSLASASTVLFYDVANLMPTRTIIELLAH